MREYNGPIASLADAFKAKRNLWALCQRCGHAKLLDPRSLIGKLGYVSLKDARPKLRCARCGQRKPSLIPKEEPWSSMR